MTLLLLFIASGATAQTVTRLPGKEDAAAAYSASIEDLCRALIDQCDILPTLPISPDEIEELRCTGRATTATCRFRASSMRCSARFLLDRSDGRRRWVVERRPPRFYGRPQVDCRHALRD